jgi:hypothetical protein
MWLHSLFLTRQRRSAQLVKAVQVIRAGLHVPRRLPRLVLLADSEGLSLIVGAPPHEEVRMSIAVSRHRDDLDHPLVHFGTIGAAVLVARLRDHHDLPYHSLLRHRWPAIGRGEGEGSGAVFRSPRRGAAAHLARAVACRPRSSLKKKEERTMRPYGVYGVGSEVAI